MTVRLIAPLPAGDDQACRVGGQLITAALELAGAAGAVAGGPVRR